MEKIEDPESLPRIATKQEIQNLIHEIDDIPITAWLLTFTGAVTQLARFGITVAWQNYLQNPRGHGPLPGALGLGQATATTIQNAFLFFQYISPLPFAILSDSWIGRYKTMLTSLVLLTTGYIILFVTSLPIALENGAGLGGLIATMTLTGLGQGGLSAVMYPFIGDQIPDRPPRVKMNKKGELVVTDRQLAIQYTFNGFYWMVNIASLSSIPTTLMEKHIDFWAAYLLPTLILAIAVLPVILWNKRLVKLPPQGNILPHASRVIWIACRSNFRLDAANPSPESVDSNRSIPWESSFVDEIRRGLKACRVIICFVVFWLCYNQTTNNIISQAGQMQLQGLSNDTISALNPIACTIVGPVIQSLIIPFLRRHRKPFGPILRMTVAFLFIAAGIAYAAGLQQLIYSRGPCYKYPLECSVVTEEEAGTSAGANNISVWFQTPLYFLLAVGEILGLVSLSEYTYSEAPTQLKAMVQALQQMAAAIGAALGMALGPISKNPWLVILYASLSGTMALSAVLFWAVFRKYDAIYEMRKAEVTEENGKKDDVE
ncbi:oligopeptide transporter [Melanomma pulvis-pyrius CBS 109.77]|uniref:Oligopeptide transporter n=1 Tax=Melanomma pulvis-pyrius CBS 109.77 TaxID=1314802 RepID=A0A6A6XF65_9PLEO|nr:oligopeptide transporter [Melanomma pulvis-pyrius CBS 109.77]